MNEQAQPGGKVQAILERYPGPVTLPASKRKWLSVLACCGVFVAMGAGMAMDETPTLNPTIAWAIAAFFGIGVVVSVLSLIPGANALMLDGQGFVMSTMFKRQARLWNDVANFQYGKVGVQHMVAYDVAPEIKIPRRGSNRALTGHDEALTETYGLSASELAQVMAEWRERAHARLNEKTEERP